MCPLPIWVFDGHSIIKLDETDDAWIAVIYFVISAFSDRYSSLIWQFL
jgi:hypothetical protein